MTDLEQFEQEIADLAAEFDSHRGKGAKKLFLPDNVKRKAAALYHRKGNMTLLDLSRLLRVSPGAIRQWSTTSRPERRRSPELIPVRVVAREESPIRGAAKQTDAIIVTFRDLVITIPATTDPGFLTKLIDTLLERAAC